MPDSPMTGALAPEVRAAVRPALEEALAGALAAPVPVREVCLFAEGRDGAFIIAAIGKERAGQSDD